MLLQAKLKHSIDNPGQATQPLVRKKKSLQEGSKNEHLERLKYPLSPAGRTNNGSGTAYQGLVASSCALIRSESSTRAFPRKTIQMRVG